jgi:hypothetical protein
MPTNNKSKTNKKDEKLKNEFFNTPTLFGEEKTSKDLEKFLYQMKFKSVQKIISRKKKTKNFDFVQKEYLEMKSKIGGL